MKTRVFGKKIENIYGVEHKWKEITNENGDKKSIYTDKPEVTKETKVVEWSELCSYDGYPRYNDGFDIFHHWGKCLNISENEEVTIKKEIFRADLNEVHLYSDKIVEEKDIDKEDAILICDSQIKAFNKMMIESNNKLKAYCDLHKLAYEDTDCIELFNLVFPDNEYVIEDGVMKAKVLKLDWYSDGTIRGRYAIDTTKSDISSKLSSAVTVNAQLK